MCTNTLPCTYVIVREYNICRENFLLKASQHSRSLKGTLKNIKNQVGSLINCFGQLYDMKQ